MVIKIRSDYKNIILSEPALFLSFFLKPLNMLYKSCNLYQLN